MSVIDRQRSRAILSYRWRPKERALISFGPVLTPLVNWNREGRVRDWAVTPEFDLELRRLTYIYLKRTESFGLIQNIGFRKHKTRDLGEHRTIQVAGFQS